MKGGEESHYRINITGISKTGYQEQQGSVEQVVWMGSGVAIAVRS